MPDKSLVYVVCPFCGLSRIREKRIKGKVVFDALDSAIAPFIDFRSNVGGKKLSGQPPGTVGRGKAPGSGFHRIDFLTLKQIKGNPEYSNLILQLKTQIKEIQKIIE